MYVLCRCVIVFTVLFNMYDLPQALKALLDIQQRDLQLLLTACHHQSSVIPAGSSNPLSKQQRKYKQHSIMMLGWEDKIDNGGKPLGKRVQRSLEEVCKTAKGLHKHFKVVKIASSN